MTGAPLTPDLVEEWHPTRNAVYHSTFGANSRKKVWWMGRCGHEWEAAIFSRSAGNGCPFCSNKKVLGGFNDLATTHPELASEWHWFSNENGPDSYTAGSSHNAWWQGPCGHEWQAAISKRKSGRGCPVCRGLKVVAGENDLDHTHPLVAESWHPSRNGHLVPHKVTHGSDRAVWWQDPDCGHEWRQPISQRTRGVAEGWNEPLVGCPFCSSRSRALTGFNDLSTTHPELALEWGSTRNGELVPSQVTSGSDRKVWWIGSGCKHEWAATIASRAGRSATGCPRCSSKISRAEQEVFECLKNLIPGLQLDVNIPVAWGNQRGRRSARCDMVSEQMGLVVEFDGWYFHRNRQQIDKLKTVALLSAGWRVVRVREVKRGHEPLPSLGIKNPRCVEVHVDEWHHSDGIPNVDVQRVISVSPAPGAP